MPVARFRLFFDNAPADQERLDRFGEIRVSQAIGMAAEAELELPIGTGLDGAWSGFDEDFTEPFKRVRVEVQLDTHPFVALIDRPVVGTPFQMSAAPDHSRHTVVVQDDSVLLNREEKVAFFEDMASHEIAEALYGEYGLQAEVDSTPAAGAALTRVVQRGATCSSSKTWRAATACSPTCAPATRPASASACSSGPARARRAAGAAAARAGPQRRRVRDGVRRAAPGHGDGRRGAHHRQKSSQRRPRRRTSHRSATRALTTC
jgi:hypothetical protein